MRSHSACTGVSYSAVLSLYRVLKMWRPSFRGAQRREISLWGCLSKEGFLASLEMTVPRGFFSILFRPWALRVAAPRSASKTPNPQTPQSDRREQRCVLRCHPKSSRRRHVLARTRPVPVRWPPSRQIDMPSFAVKPHTVAFPYLFPGQVFKHQEDSPGWITLAGQEQSLTIPTNQR
jgi:hypothetical protein